MKILHIASDFSNTKVHSNLYRELDILGVDQIVFNPIRIIRRDTIGRNEFPAHNTQFVYADVVKPFHHFMYHIKSRCLYKALLKRVDVSDINLTHAATLMTDGGIAYKLYRDYRIPYVISLRNTDINGFLGKMPHTWWNARKILLNAKRIFFISQGLKEQFENHMVIKPILPKIKDKFVLMPNGIDDYYLTNIQTERREGHRVIYIGDFSDNKNVVRLGNAILQLRKDVELEDVSLTLVGGGRNDNDSVEHMIAEHPEAFYYVGKIYDKEKLISLMREHKVFAMPSIYETFGLVYLEALSQNLPVLYTKGQGIDGLFDDTIGIGVNPLSVQDIVDALKTMLLDKGRFSNGHVDFEAFRWSNIAEKYCEHYRKVLGCATKKRSLLTRFKRVVRGGGNLIYRLRNNHISLTTQIGKHTHLRGCKIGKYVYVGSHCVMNHVTIGNYTCIASTAAIGGMEHSYWYPSISPLLSNECVFGCETRIGNDVWIGAHVCVKQGISIGDGAVIGAGSVVTHDIPPYTIAYGVPAKVVKRRFENEKKEQLVKGSKYWELEPDKAKELIVRIDNID